MCIPLAVALILSPNGQMVGVQLLLVKARSVWNKRRSIYEMLVDKHSDLVYILSRESVRI